MIYNGQTAINHPWSACTRVSILIIQHLLCAISIIKGGRERVKVKLPFATVILFPEICFRRDSSCNNFCHFKFCVTCKSSNCLRVYVVTSALLSSLSMQSFLSQKYNLVCLHQCQLQSVFFSDQKIYHLSRVSPLSLKSISNRLKKWKN